MEKTYFEYAGKNTRIKQIAKKANNIVSSDTFHYRIQTKPDGYMWSSASGARISKYIKDFPHTMNIELYTSKNPWSKANGYFTPSKPHTIHLNTRKLARTNGSIIATVCHELVHAVDAEAKSDDFGHNGNKYSIEKEASAPFYIDNIAESMASNKPISKLPDRASSYKIKYVPVWYKRIFMPWTWF